MNLTKIDECYANLQKKSNYKSSISNITNGKIALCNEQNCPFFISDSALLRCSALYNISFITKLGTKFANNVQTLKIRI